MSTNRGCAMQMLSSVSPGLELRSSLVRLLRSIFADTQAVDAETGFLHKMQRMTGATVDNHGACVVVDAALNIMLVHTGTDAL